MSGRSPLAHGSGVPESWTPTIHPVARVLIVARNFPPMGGAGVHRTLGSVRHLARHGYEPVVITGPAREAARNR